MKKETLQVRVVNKGQQALPEYATEHAAGMDLRANLEEAVVLVPGQRQLIGTGLHIHLPEGTEAQIRPRSGLALKHGITVLNSPGTIDADYRGEVKVLLINLGQEPFIIAPGERIAQMVVAEYRNVNWQKVQELDPSGRGSGGYGHTGKK